MMSVFNIFVFILSVGVLHHSRTRISQLSFRVLVGLMLGVAYGLLLRTTPANSTLEVIKSTLYLIGNGYLALLKMLVVPLILTSIMNAIINLGADSQSKLKTISIMSIAMLLAMTAVSSLVGLLIGKWFNVGAGMSLAGLTAAPKHQYTGLTDTLLHMLPANPFAIMAEENTIAIVIFAVLLGLAARMLKEKDQEKFHTLKHLLAALFSLVKKLASLVLGFTPYGILALMSLFLLDQGLSVLSSMMNFVLAMYVAMLVVLLMHSFILVLCGQNPWTYFKKAYVPLLVAFTTRSSFGTLPVTEQTLQTKFTTSETVATFVPSMGATLGMNACAGIFPAMLVVMALTILHQPLTLETIVIVMFINAIASLGISGIPGTAFVAATVTLTSLNLPYAIVALVQGIDPIVDMGRTAVNVNGVLTTAVVVDKVTK